MPPVPADAGWEDVTDPREVQRAQQYVLPQAPPSQMKTGKTTDEDKKELERWRVLADSADQLQSSGDAFSGRVARFHPGATKDMLFGAMYPDTSGVAGYIKAPVGALLRGTLGALYPQRDHDDYQFLSSRAAAINNAALRLEKGVQTKSDEVRIGREHVGVDKSPQVNSDIIHASDRNVAIAHARNLAANKWVGAFGSLTGTRNVHGATYEEWFQKTVLPKALQQLQSRSAPANGGWSISRNP